MSPRALLIVAILLLPVTVVGLVATVWAYNVADVDGAAVMFGFTVVVPALLVTCTWLHRRELLAEHDLAPPATDPAALSGPVPAESPAAGPAGADPAGAPEPAARSA